MKIICLVKFTPDVDSFEYDYEKQVLKRENVKQIINPEDACALGFALRLKKKHPEIEISVLSMAPTSAKAQMEDIARRNADQAVLISDPVFGGSDTLATSMILGKYLEGETFDVILTGSHSLDGDTAHVPAQLAEYLKLNHMSGIQEIDEESFLAGKPVVTVNTDDFTERFEVDFPAVLSVSRGSKYKLPFVRFADLDLDVSSRIRIVSNDELKMDTGCIGLQGSATRVVRTWLKTYEEKKTRQVVKNDEEGVEIVYEFLKEHGYLS